MIFCNIGLCSYSRMIIFEVGRFYFNWDDFLLSRIILFKLGRFSVKYVDSSYSRMILFELL